MLRARCCAAAAATAVSARRQLRELRQAVAVPSDDATECQRQCRCRCRAPELSTYPPLTPALTAACTSTGRELCLSSTVSAADSCMSFDRRDGSGSSCRRDRRQRLRRCECPPTALTASNAEAVHLACRSPHQPRQRRLCQPQHKTDSTASGPAARAATSALRRRQQLPLLLARCCAAAAITAVSTCRQMREWCRCCGHCRCFCCGTAGGNCVISFLCVGLCDEITGHGTVLCARQRRRRRCGPATAAGSRSGGSGASDANGDACATRSLGWRWLTETMELTEVQKLRVVETLWPRPPLLSVCVEAD